MWRRIQKLLATLVPALLLVLYFGVLVCYLNRWDALVAVTLIPVWAWAGLGMIVSLVSWIAFRGLPSLVVFSVWLATGIIGAEETHGLLREFGTMIDPKRELDPERRFRVVNVNADGSVNALARVAEQEPDLVVIQEAPDEEELRAWVDKTLPNEFTLVADHSLAILAATPFLEVITDTGGEAIHARLQLDNGMLLDTTSLSLEKCFPKFSLWNPETWNELEEARKQNRRMLRTHLGENQISLSSIGRIVSGGFQTPPGDDVFRPLESNAMTDTFAEKGLGLGNTFPSDYPWLRVDQISASDNLEIHTSETLMTPGGDHRMVVTDLVLPASL